MFQPIIFRQWKTFHASIDKEKNKIKIEYSNQTSITERLMQHLLSYFHKNFKIETPLKEKDKYI
jgi:hypothetical protein